MHDSFEAVETGETIDLGSYTVSREEIRDFARQYDPQRFHLEDGPDNPFDGVIASGWHTASITMRLLVDGYLGAAKTLGSPGLEGLRWETPVRPGDTLSATLTFAEKEHWDDTRGLVHQHVETNNQDDAVVLWMDALVLYGREQADAQ